MSQQIELLDKLLSFYKSRYKDKELEEKFNNAVEDLIETGDIQKGVYIKYCVENDIEPKINKDLTKKLKGSDKTGYSSWGNSGCGSGGYTRSSC